MFKNINKFLGVFALSASLLFVASDANAATGAANSYNVQINKVELCKSAACTNPILVGSGAASFDIASTAVGASVGSYASLSGVPEGTTVTHIRVTMSRTIGVSGSIPDPGNVGGACATNSADASSSITAAGIGAIGGVPSVQNLVVPNETAIGGQPPAGTYAGLGVTLISATEMQILQALPAPYTFGEVPPTVDIAFETAAGLQAFDSNGALAGGNCWMLPGPPTVQIKTK